MDFMYIFTYLSFFLKGDQKDHVQFTFGSLAATATAISVPKSPTQRDFMVKNHKNPGDRNLNLTFSSN